MLLIVRQWDIRVAAVRYASDKCLPSDVVIADGVPLDVEC
jgi:hypothetical protein